jgi:16S rRNA (cytidine1402-2'-O)-methyltransferase
LRALRELRETSLILAEDTRHTRKLLTYFGISKPLLSYHEHNQRAREERVLHALTEGDVALVSDAGMPGISDPGFALISAAITAGMDVEVLPGANAAITAVALAGLDAPGFLFMGFLPRGVRQRRERLAEIEDLRYSIVLYEAPHRVRKTLDDLQEILGDRKAVAARELTKMHEEVVRGTLSALARRYEESEPRGEITLVIGPHVEAAIDRSAEARAELARRREMGEDRRSAVEAVTREFGMGRNAAYRMWLELRDDGGRARG